MKIKLTFIVALVIATQVLYGQFDAQQSQYMLHHAGFNPAAAGEAGKIDVTGQHRLQWIGMPNGGSTTLFGLNAPLRLGDRTLGLGILFQNDRVGLFVNQGVHLQNAFRIKLGSGNLNIGAQLGFLSVGFRGDSARGPQVPLGDYHDISGDPAIPKTMVEGFGFDAGLGLWYTQGNFYAGLSVSRINQPVIEWGEEYEFKPASTFYLTGGFNRTLNNPRWVVTPSFLAKTDTYTFEVDLSTVVHYNQQYWGGLSFRYGNAVVILAGINIGTGLSLGYAFDLPISRLIQASWGSHEIMLSYEMEMNLGGVGRRKNYKSIRIL